MRARRGLAASVASLALALGGCATLPPPATTGDGTTLAPAARQVVVTVRNGAPAGSAGVGSSGGAYGGLGRYRASPAALRDADAIAARHRLRALTAWPIELLGVHCIVYAIDDDRAVDEVLRELRADRGVESAQPLQLFHSLTKPARGDDPYASLQEGLASTEVREAQRWTRGAGVRVAVIDSGVDDTHPELLHRVVLQRDYTGQRAGAGRHDRHGTAVAGVIAANAGNGVGIVGVAPEASVLALRACWQDAAGAGSTVCNTLTLAQALVAAATEGADVVNLSLAGPADPLLERLLRRALAKGKVVVAAVPEDGSPAAPAFPASVPGVLAVASAGSRAAPGVDGVLRAPGHDVLTLQPGGGYDFDSGSSLAAAHVSGIAALLRSLRPDLSGDRVRTLLLPPRTSVAAADGGSEPLVNACRAVVTLRGSGDCGGVVRRMRAARQ